MLQIKLNGKRRQLIVPLCRWKPKWQRYVSMAGKKPKCARVMYQGALTGDIGLDGADIGKIAVGFEAELEMKILEV